MNVGCGQNKTKTITKTPTRYESVGCDEENFSSPEESLPASGVNAFISHRKHRIHRLLFIIPFTLVFNSQNLQVASPLLPSGGKHKRSVCASVYFCEFCVRQKNRENQRYPCHPCSKREHVTKTNLDAFTHTLSLCWPSGVNAFISHRKHRNTQNFMYNPIHAGF